MYDRPSIEELLAAVQVHLEENIVPLIKEDRKRYFQTLVAVNLLKITRRELAQNDAHLEAEWQRLNSLMSLNEPYPVNIVEARTKLELRNRQLCLDIQTGQYDERRDDLIRHLKATTIEQLQVANPKFLEGDTNE